MTKSSTYKSRLLTQLTATLLLVIYLSSSFSFDFVHQLVHEHHHDELHSEENELDACHRHIYHGDSANGCDHKAHFIPVEEDCDLCELLIQHQTFPEVKKQATVSSLNYDDLAALPLIFYTQYYRSSQARAPPFA